MIASSDSRSIVLAVDDNPESLGLVCSALEAQGMTVLVARTGEAAIELARRVQPDVILMDAVMPGMDGFETCRRLKQNPEFSWAPVIFMTGLSEPENVLKGLKMGGVDYVTKPVVVEELVARVTVHLLNARLIRGAQGALDTTGRSVLAFDTEARLIWGSPLAMSWARSEAGILGADGRAKPEACRWLQRSEDLPVSMVEPYEVGRRQLHYIGTIASGERLVKLQEGSNADGPAHLSSQFGLTPREAEVLLWLTRGKTNRDIGEILNLSARTVNKHLEQVFQKLGVDNRTSAAIVADRALNAG